MKRIAALLTILLLMTGSAGASVCARTDAGAALLEADGSVRVAPGAYADLVALGGDRFAAQSDGKYALMDTGGALLTQPLYDYLRMADGFLIAERDGLRGMLSTAGAELSAFEYRQLIPNGQGGCWALRESGELNSDELFVLDAAGAQRATGLYLRAAGEAAGEGLLAVQLRRGGRFGYCDAAGVLAIAADYDYAGGFVCGLASVVRDELYGAIDARGAWVIEPEYDFLEISEAGFVIAAKSLEGVYVLGPDGAERARFEGERMDIAQYGAYYAVKDAQTLHLFDADDKLLMEAGAQTALYAALDGQLIVADGAWGEQSVCLLNTQNRYQDLFPLGTANGAPIYGCLKVNVARYMNDLLGEIQLSADMESARYGVTDASGEMLLDFNYQSIEFLTDDRLLVRTDARWQMIDTAGHVYWELAAAKQTEAPSF